MSRKNPNLISRIRQERAADEQMAENERICHISQSEPPIQVNRKFKPVVQLRQIRKLPDKQLLNKQPEKVASTSRANPQVHSFLSDEERKEVREKREEALKKALQLKKRTEVITIDETVEEQKGKNAQETQREQELQIENMMLRKKLEDMHKLLTAENHSFSRNDKATQTDSSIMVRQYEQKESSKVFFPQASSHHKREMLRRENANIVAIHQKASQATREKDSTMPPKAKLARDANPRTDTTEVQKTQLPSSSDSAFSVQQPAASCGLIAEKVQPQEATTLSFFRPKGIELNA